MSPVSHVTHIASVNFTEIHINHLKSSSRAIFFVFTLHDRVFSLHLAQKEKKTYILI